MSDIRNQHEIDELNKRLYERGIDASRVERHQLSDTTVDVARDWGAQATEPVATTFAPTHSYRKFVLLASLGIFLVVAALSLAYFFFGNSRISGDNIAFNIAGNTNISGGETVSFQIGVTNQNTVAIEGASLIVKYPEGTRSVTEPVKNLYEERIEIGALGPGEAKNIPIQVAIYGKENQQLQMHATLEYRIVGSDGIFFKEADPITFQITSSPIILQVDSVRRVSAGQPVVMTLTAKSNTNKVLKDVLITAKYPSGFAFKNAVPEPLYNQNVWKIAELKPEETKKIVINGSVTGLTNEGMVVDFSAGAALTDNEFIVGSLLAETRAEFILEQPFVAVDIIIAGDDDRSVVLEQNKRSVVQVVVKNTLSEPVYDMAVEVVPTGNALSPSSIESRQGFYDSNRGLVRFDVTNTDDFTQLQPGQSRSLNFSIVPEPTDGASAFNVAVNVYAKRVADPAAEQKLIGTVTAEARYASVAGLTSSLSHVTGPVPPKVGQATRYLVKLGAVGGANNLTNTAITTSLPTYVEWQNEYSGPGTVSYNPVSRQLVWNPGDIIGGGQKELTFALNLLPSLSQVGSTPILVQDQTLQAIDRFTNTPVSASGAAVTTELTDYAEGNGSVIE